MTALLLVDGDENFRRALAVALRLEGADVTEAASVEEALALLVALRFDAVLVDLLLAGARAFVAQFAHDLRVVVCSQHTESLEAVAPEFPGIARMAKPFGSSELLALTSPR